MTFAEICEIGPRQRMVLNDFFTGEFTSENDRVLIKNFLDINFQILVEQLCLSEFVLQLFLSYFRAPEVFQRSIIIDLPMSS